MAADWRARLTPQEREKLLQLDLKELEAAVEQVIKQIETEPDLDSLLRIGSVTLGLLARVPIQSHSLVAAIAIEKLIQERRKSG